MAALGTQMWPLQPLAFFLLPQCCTLWVDTHDLPAPRLCAEMECMGCLCLCLCPPSAVSLKTSICCIRKVILAELRTEVLT